MRSSSISSAGYSYAKTNPPHPHHLPQPTTGPHPHPNTTTSPHHYSHLRSRSGPPILPQMSAILGPQQPPPPQFHPQQRPMPTTCFNGETEATKSVQRQFSQPTGRAHPLQNHLSRRESAPAVGMHPDTTLEGVIDNLTKMTQELGVLEENIFTSGKVGLFVSEEGCLLFLISMGVVLILGQIKELGGGHIFVRGGFKLSHRSLYHFICTV